MNRLLTQDELLERVEKAVKASADEAGITVEQWYQKLTRAWNKQIARDEREEAAGLWNG